MNCPRCINRGMEKVDVAGVTVDRCEVCGGIWCDAKEGREIMGAGEAQSVDVVARTEAADSDRLMHCPRCQQMMNRFKVKNQQHIVLDQCMVCYGTFYDAGELADAGENSVGDFFKGLKAKIFGAH